MKINEIKYSRVFNLGNYENETVSIGVFVEEGEDPSKILSDVKGFVNTAKTRSVNPPSPVNAHGSGDNEPRTSPANAVVASPAVQGSNNSVKTTASTSTTDYVIKMGKFKGRTFGSFSTDEIPKLDNYVEWLCDDAASKKKKLTGSAKELVEAYDAHFGMPRMDKTERIPF